MSPTHDRSTSRLRQLAVGVSTVVIIASFGVVALMVASVLVALFRTEEFVAITIATTGFVTVGVGCGAWVATRWLAPRLLGDAYLPAAVERDRWAVLGGIAVAAVTTAGVHFLAHGPGLAGYWLVLISLPGVIGVGVAMRTPTGTA